MSTCTLHQAADCPICRATGGRIVIEEVWRAEHAPHNSAAAGFGRQNFPHVSREWYLLVCGCGAKFLSTPASRGMSERRRA